MGSTRTETTTSQQSQNQLQASGLQQLNVQGAGAQEQLASLFQSGLLNQLPQIAQGFGDFASQLQPSANNLLQQFRGLPSIGTALGFLQGGATADQRRILDARTAEAFQGAEQFLGRQTDRAFDIAGGRAAALGAQTGLTGSFQAAPFASAAADASLAGGQLAQARGQFRGGVGQQVGGSILTAQQQALGNLFGISDRINQARSGQAQVLGAASDVAARSEAGFRQERLATGQQVSSQQQSGSSSAQGSQVQTSQQPLFQQLLQGILGAGVAFGPQGVLPGVFPGIGDALSSLGGIFGGGQQSSGFTQGLPGLQGGVPFNSGQSFIGPQNNVGR